MSYDLVCLSHLRWDFVYQRPQHLLSRFAREHRVFYVEEPVLEGQTAWAAMTQAAANIWIVRPHIPTGLVQQQQEAIERGLLDQVLRAQRIEQFVLWYYTPMALGFSRHLVPVATVYDCMDELSLFAGAPALLRERERELFSRADLVFTGGQGLYEAKRSLHRNVYAFPSSVDTSHFGMARTQLPEPNDQRAIPHPRLGFFGVIDERMDLDLVARIADQRPDWHLVLVGPVVKIDPSLIPVRPNVHLLGAKSYASLPTYIAGWDVAIMPFAFNDATRFISPTKTLEYLAAGKAVVSTAIADVVRPYGERGLVRIGRDGDAFIAAVEDALRADHATVLPQVDAFLATTSWDRTWRRMQALIDAVQEARGEHVLPLVHPAARARQNKQKLKQAYGKILAFPTPPPPALAVLRGEEAE